jgi:hypothetical protein
MGILDQKKDACWKKAILTIAVSVFTCVLPIKVMSQIQDSVKLKIQRDSLEFLRSIDSVSNSSKVKKSGKFFLPDTLFLKTGDRITGKILSFEQGRVKIDAQAAGVLTIKWNQISTVGGGNRIFKIEDLYGEIYVGRISASADTGEVLILTKPLYGKKLNELIRIFPIESEWYRGFKGDLGGGVSYTKSSDILRINAEYNLYYVISKWRLINNFSYIETSDNNTDPTATINLDLEARYALHRKWILAEINSFNRNDELGIKARYSAGLGGGNSIIQTEKQRLLIMTGIIGNAEKAVESDSFTFNAEWPVSLEHTVYSFIRPNLSSTIKIISYTGISEQGRYRLDASADLSWEFIKNFKLQFSVYYNYDNKILAGKNSKEDFGTVLSLLLDLR